jgi:hypothetical protein
MFYRFNISLLHLLCQIEKKCKFISLSWIKILLLKKLITYKDFINSDISNIVCTKLDKFNKCERAITKLSLYSWHIFCISPRALVFCVLHNNSVMLTYLRSMGYPLEMIKYADNYHLVQKKRLENFIYSI